MQPDTIAAFISKFARQVPVGVGVPFLVLDATHRNSIIVIDNSDNPVAVTLPPADDIRAGGYFLIFALTDANPISVRVQEGDTYNKGASTPIVLDQTGQILTVFTIKRPEPSPEPSKPYNLRLRSSYRCSEPQTLNIGGV